MLAEVSTDLSGAPYEEWRAEQLFEPGVYPPRMTPFLAELCEAYAWQFDDAASATFRLAVPSTVLGLAPYPVQFLVLDATDDSAYRVCLMEFLGDARQSRDVFAGLEYAHAVEAFTSFAHGFWTRAQGEASFPETRLLYQSPGEGGKEAVN